MKIFFLFLGNILFNASGNLLMKMGMRSEEKLEFSFFSVLNGLILNPALVAGVTCYFLSLVCYIFVLRRLNLSIAYPILVSCSIMIVGAMSKLLFREAISIAQIAGYCFILIGIFIIGRA